MFHGSIALDVKGGEDKPATQRKEAGQWPAALAILSIAALACGGIANPLDPPGPLSGRWNEVAQVECDTGKEITPPEPIRELDLRSGSKFSVTWHPFESYRDYWGTYTYDDDTDTLTLTIDSGNYEPTDADLEGTATLDADGRLVLTDIWLGSPRSSSYQPTPTSPTDTGVEATQAVRVCGQIFEEWD